MRHRFHALCPYFAMFPEGFAETWIRRLTKPGDVVLDPFAGRGTTPFQASLMGRKAIAADVNPVAFCVTRAKTHAPAHTTVSRRLRALKARYDPTDWEINRRALPPFFRYAYHAETLRQLLYLREALKWDGSRADCMLAAVTLGSLHGDSNRSDRYLSNQMPRTISTKPNYSISYWRRHGHRPPRRNAFELLHRQLAFRYVTPPPAPSGALIFHTDMRELPRKLQQLDKPVKCVITSPPYLDVTSFEEDQWLRLWFLGGPPHPTKGRVSRDDRHRSEDGYWRLMADMWRSLGQIVSNEATIVLRLGMKNRKAEDVARALEASAMVSCRQVRLVTHRASAITGRQTTSFRPGAKGCRQEVDCIFEVK
jgi:DNA methylase